MGSINTLLAPDDLYNRELLQNAHPPAWINPQPHEVYNLVVLGAAQQDWLPRRAQPLSERVLRSSKNA